MVTRGARVDTQELLVEGTRVFMRSTAGAGVPTVFVHGHPTSSEDWLPFMERLEGRALAPDLPGWGRSERPAPARFDFTMNGLGEFFGRWLDAAGVGTYRLVCHDWGVVSLIAAQAHPERVQRLVVINGVPLLPGYRWHWIARLAWRRRGIGELANLTLTRPGLRQISRQATPRPGPMPAEFIEAAWRRWPRGTWPQALALYRSADPAALAAAGARLGAITCPALVAWGLHDRYLPPAFGRLYAERLPGAELVELDGGGHWPWIDCPDLVGTVVGFLDR